MKISIDTKEDSPEEIRKIIKMLSSIVGKGSFSNQPNIFEDDGPGLGDDAPIESKEAEPTNAFANIFGSEPTTPSEEPSETEDDEVNVEEKEEAPDVEEYH